MRHEGSEHANGVNDNFRPKIVIVEDEFLVALQLEDILQAEGYAIVGTVADRASLLEVNEAPDVALIDLNLRDGPSGPEIARWLADTHGATVIYVTANPTQIDEPASTAIGIVQKPFSKESIVSAVRYAVDGLSGAIPPDFQPISPPPQARIA